MSRFLLILFAGAIALSFPCVGVLVTRRHRLLLRRRLRRLIRDSNSADGNGHRLQRRMCPVAEKAKFEICKSDQ